MVNEILKALWGKEPATFNTTWGAIDVKPIFSADGDGSRLTINASNITQDLLDWLEHDLETTGNIAIGINFSNGRSTTANDGNISNGSTGTTLYRLYVDYPDWAGTTVRVNLHNLLPGINRGTIRTTDGTLANFEVVTIGNLTPVTSVAVTGSATTISTDNGELQLSAIVGPTDAYDQTIKWSVETGSEVAAISNTGHGTTGRLYALKNGTVQVYATSIDTGVISAPFTVVVSGQVGPAAPSGIGKTDETYAGANDGTLTGVASGQEYQLIGDPSWTSVSGTTVTGLPPGSYWVRVAETKTAPAGATTAALAIEPGPAKTISIVARDPGSTGGSDLNFDAATNTFSGAIDFYAADASVGRIEAGNYIGVQITAPESVAVDREKASFTYTNASGNQILIGSQWLDGDDYVYYYPRVTEVNQEFVIVIDWDGSGMAYAPETIVIKVAGVSLDPPPASSEE